MDTRIFPAALIVLQFGAAIVYATNGEWMKSGYWISAVAITFFAAF